MRAYLQGRAVAALLFGAASLALAHGRNDLRLTMDVPGIAGLTVELHQDGIAPQLVVGNRTGKLLEILDSHGQVFLRITPDGAQANLAAPAWYASLVPGGARAPKQVRQNRTEAEPQWQTVSREPAYGWFDPRIALDRIAVPPELEQAGVETRLNEWTVPIRLGGQVLQLHGLLLYIPPPPGLVVAVLRSPAQIGPGISVSLASGPAPAFFLQNRSGQTVSVLDGADRPFLKLAPDGVWADTGSAAWKASGRSGKNGANAKPDPNARWQKISTADSYSWVEPRAAFSGAVPSEVIKAGKPAELGQWQVPLLMGGRRLELQGVTQYQPQNRPTPSAAQPESVWD